MHHLFPSSLHKPITAMDDFGYTCVKGGPYDNGKLCNFDQGSANLLTGSVKYANPGYRPSLVLAAVFIALFGLSTLVHVAQAIRRRTYWLLYTVVLCGVGEMIGWAGRLVMYTSTQWKPEQGGEYNFSATAFMMQISTLIFSPSFLLAALFLILGRIVRSSGSAYCRLSNTTFSAIFITFDVVFLVVQAAGGGTAASARTYAQADTGANIMVGGVMGQLVVLVLFLALLADFVINRQRQREVRQLRPFGFLRALRCRRNKPQAQAQTQASRQDSLSTISPIDSSTKPELESQSSLSPAPARHSNIQLLALIFATLCIFTRGVFRSVELLGGWNGKLVRDQTAFAVLDAGAVLLAMITLNVFHPGWLLAEAERK